MAVDSGRLLTLAMVRAMSADDTWSRGLDVASDELPMAEAVGVPPLLGFWSTKPRMARRITTLDATKPTLTARLRKVLRRIFTSRFL